jgi:hypothetical protein
MLIDIAILKLKSSGFNLLTGNFEGISGGFLQT